jgi:signal peptidase II
MIMIAVGLLVIFLDQLVKHWITQYFSPPGRWGTSIPIFGHVLELIYVQNRGVAFSLLDGQSSLYVLIAVAVGVIVWLYWHSRDTGSLLLKVTFGLIIGGALGNLIDRLRLGYVVDFVHFQIPAIGFNFAVFNVADSCISVGVVLLITVLVFANKPATSGNDAPSGPLVANEVATSRPRVRRRI